MITTDNDTTRGASPDASEDKKDILAQARKDWDRAMDKERDNVRLAYEDLEFLSGINQWPEKQRQQRDQDGRPTLTINRLPQFVHQITGDMRQMKPSLKFVPVDSKADEKRADLYGGLARYIENRSDAGAVYARAADSQVACGIGHWRVETEYADDSTFEQEIRIAPIEDGVAVLWDPDSKLPTKEDAKFCFVPVDMSKVAFKEAYPKASPASFEDEKWALSTQWMTDEHVRIAEYWTRKPAKKLLALTKEGSILDLTDEDDPKAAAALAKKYGARIEERDSYTICRYLISAAEVLDDTEWPGRLIPIVPVLGEEIRIGRKVIRNGIVRHAKDPQRMYNYFHSAHTEVVALQPKAPFMLTSTNVGKYQGLWEQANTQNRPYLLWEPDKANGGAAPQRIQPPVSSQGVTEGLQLAAEDLKAVTGIYDASLGAKSNETSGKAIMARQREGDVGSFVYIDNFSRSIRRTGQILVDLIPHIYDTERSIRIMGEDGKIDVMEINKAQGLGPDAEVLNDVTVGAYDVVATMGPSYSTRREEARDGMLQFLQAAPEVAPLILDKVAKAQDWPMADDIAKRIRANLPPQILAMEEAEEKGMDPEQARQQAMQQNPPPPDPKILELQARQQSDQAKFQMDHEAAQTKFQLEHQKQTDAVQLKLHEMQAAQHKAILDANTKIEVAQIMAEMGMHKTIIDAATSQYGTDVGAQTAAQASATQAETARHGNEVKASTALQTSEAKAASDGAKPKRKTGFDVLQDGAQQNAQALATAVQAMTAIAQEMTQVGQAVAHAVQVAAAPKHVTVKRDPKTGALTGDVRPLSPGSDTLN